MPRAAPPAPGSAGDSDAVTEAVLNDRAPARADHTNDQTVAGLSEATRELLSTAQGRPLIDHKLLGELRDSLGAEGLIDLLRLVPESADQAMTRLHQAWRSNQADELKMAAHTIRGLAGSFGAPRAAALAHVVYDQIAFAKGAGLDLLVTALSRALEETYRQFELEQ
ncbi:MAG: hypothetical protein GC191_02005 [Azospirillum sp.]|nr:hypothetical protein [Azospirillum sp.]